MSLHAPTVARSPSSRRVPVTEGTTALEPDRPSLRDRLVTALALAVILTTFAVRAWDVARRDSITSDETTHLTRSLRYWLTGQDPGMWELGAPHLPHLAYGLASYLASRPSGLLPESPDEARLTAVVISGDPRVLQPARALAIGSGVAMLLAVFWSVARNAGAALALIATGLVSLIPECLAHSAIAGSDMPFTASAMLALILLSRFAEHPSWGRWGLVALAVGLAWSMRHSALLLLILATGVHLAVHLRRAPGDLIDRLFGSLLATLGLVLVAFAVLWVGDGLQMPTVGAVSERVTTLNVPDRLGPFDLGGCRVPTPLLSVLKQVRHQAQGHEAYFCGSYSQSGWPAYFPVAFLIKNPVGLLALLVLAAARVRPGTAWDTIALAALGLLWLMLVANRVNIGVRYALLTYPLAAGFLARLFTPAMLRDRVWGPLTIAAAIGLGAASVSSHPRYLSAFNELVGGPRQGWQYLADSNLDWGQDFHTLAEAIPRLGITEVTYDISSECRLNIPGVLAIRHPNRSMQLPGVTPPNRRLFAIDGTYQPVYTRYVAVSASRLLGLYSQNDMSWLRSRRLVARLGDSLFLFDLDYPADQPL